MRRDSGAKVVVAFGDSTTAPRDGVTVYADLLQQYWQSQLQNVKVINAGVRGDHTDRALARLASDVLAYAPDIVIIRFGINDSAIDVWETPPASEPRVPMGRFRANIIAMVDALAAQGALPLLCTPNPLAWSEITLALYGKSPYLPDDSDGFNVLLQEYVCEIKALAAQLGLPLVDVDEAFRQHHSDLLPTWQSLLLDGMHPNDEGHRVAAWHLLPQLDVMLGKLI